MAIRKGKIIREIRQIFKIPINGINIIPVKKNMPNTILKMNYSFIEKTSLILHNKKGGKILNCFLSSRTILMCLQKEKNLISDKIVRKILIGQTLLQSVDPPRTGDICKTLKCPIFFPLRYHRTLHLQKLLFQNSHFYRKEMVSEYLALTFNLHDIHVSTHYFLDLTKQCLYFKKV